MEKNLVPKPGSLFLIGVWKRSIRYNNKMSVSGIRNIRELLHKTAEHRKSLVSSQHQNAFRLFNGFFEGYPDLVADIYGGTLVLFIYCKDQAESHSLVQIASEVFLDAFPWIKCIIEKHHNHPNKEFRRGKFVYGSHPDEMIIESRVKYAVNLLINQDAGFYLDTRNLRNWLLANSGGLEVLNTFAYTGSLGVAALAGGAHKVMQMDRNRRYLELARRSAAINHLDLQKMKLAPVDFFVGVGQLKRSGVLFDLVLLDPPFFSITEKGTVNQAKESHRLINKVRPLVRDGGRIVAINNSLFLEGSAYRRSLDGLAADGFIAMEQVIPVPEDITGYPESVVNKPPLDPEPFNHPTKIVVLKIRRKI